MSYTVKAGPSRLGEGSGTFAAQSRKDAILKATDLLGQGCQNVTITDEAGKVFTPAQFKQFFDEGDD